MANTANCDDAVGDLTNLGSYAGSSSPYGTFDQGGNVWEWNETIVADPDRGLRGGAFWDITEWIAAWRRNYTHPGVIAGSVGFRVAGLAPDCEDEVDNDGDGFTDFVGGDPGCTEAGDLSENDPTLPCDDGADNDGDGMIDFDPLTQADPGDQYNLPAGSGDPGCINPTWASEEPGCQDGIDNDGDGMMDYDAGLLANGSANAGGPDPQCIGKPWAIVEGLSCGLGTELTLLLPPLLWLYWRRARSA
jgi:hypothetical protein